MGVEFGIIMYGITNNKNLNLESTFKLKSEVIQINELKEGETVGYGGMYIAKEKEKIAVIPIGYEDGIIRKNTGRDVFINGKRYPIVGNVCMDLLMVDITHSKGEIKAGDEVIFWGENGIPMEEYAEISGNINYTIYTGVTPRVTRIYK